MKKKYLIYTLSTIPLAITISNVSESDAFFRLDNLITKNKTVSDTVNIKDDNLLKAINNQLGRGEVLDDVTIEDMESLTVLNAYNKNISSIDGLNYAVNLRELNLGSNEITDVSQIRGLTNLVKLYIHYNQISDISSLGNLTNLTHLDSGGNQISDISVLANFKNLQDLRIGTNKIEDISIIGSLNKLNHLYLGINQISDISMLNGLTNLKNLYLNNNQISDISALEELTNLNILYLNNNQISNISALENLTNLTHLHLNNNHVSDISSLNNLTNLNTLRLDNNQISGISILNNLTNLIDLQLTNNQISDISILKNLTNLNILYLNNNQIIDISALSNLTNLTNLYLHNNQISDISVLSNLRDLEDLRVGANQIIDISVIKNLNALTRLEIYNNRMSDISSLRNLSGLKYLDLSNNEILDISALENLHNLTHLYLQNNQILDISILSNLINLNTLYLYNNQILDISSLRNLNKLATLYLYNNQISNISHIRNLKNLTTLHLSNQKPIIDVGDFKTKTNTLDILINNPIVGLNSKVSKITNISNNGFFEDKKLKWNNAPLGSHTRTFNFSENVTIGSATTTFNGTVTLNFNVIDGYAPESDHISEFDNNDFGIYATVTAEDLGTGVDYLIHKGVRQSLPYRFKYDVLEPINNIVEVYDLAGNKAEYQVKLKDNDIPAIEEGIDALINKDDIEKEDISYFRAIINDLDESMKKNLLQDRLNNIYPNTLSLDRKLTTSNLDLYIKCENILQMSLDTNQISFDDFSGIEDVVKENAVNVTINSSLPYQLNAYLPTEIQNTDKTKTMDKSILNIKENSQSNYQTFTNTTDKIILKDNCSAGNYLTHGVDLKLARGIAHEKDVYKATIKLEAEQK